MLLQHAATKVLIFNNFLRGWYKYVQQRFSTCNATMFHLQVAAVRCSYYFTVTQLGPSLETLDIAFRTSAVP